jgi:hypothetical protein
MRLRYAVSIPFGMFLLATAFSATDEDLLLNRALPISQLGGTAVRSCSRSSLRLRYS